MNETFNTFRALYAALLVAMWAVMLTLVSGWLNNVLWTFHQADVTQVLLGILGAIVAPIGALHGIYLWFV